MNPQKRSTLFKACVYTIAGLLLLSAILLSHYKNGFRGNSSFPEIAELEQKHLSPKDFFNYFKKLAEDKGAVYAYDVLKVAPVPPYTDLHLVGHTIGDILYKQEGAKGIVHCTQDFRNACSHTIVIGLFGDKGEAAFPEITESCKNAPGGPGAYTMCFHGLGHGIFSIRDYDMKATVATCNKLGPTKESRESIECIGGMIMESISGGGHDPQNWQKQYDRNYSDTDPLFPCNSDVIPDNAKSICYVYLTPELFIRAGAKLAHPTGENFRAAFPYCNTLTDQGLRIACYGGFGKEFVVLARERDIRAGTPITDAMLKQVNAWCSLADSKDGIQACITYAEGSLFWGGEGNPTAAARLCAHADAGDRIIGNACYQQVVDEANRYLTNPDKHAEFCNILPERYVGQCLGR